MSIRLAPLLIAFLLAACNPEAETGGGAPPPPAVTVAKPLVREVIEDDEFVGRFAAIEDVNVRARVSGYLESIHFDDGSMVAEDDLLFTIDQRPFETARDEAAARLRTAQAQLDFAQAQFQRGQDLVGRGTIAQALFQEREQAQLSAQANLDAAQAAYERAQLDMIYTEVRAPVSGRVDRNLVSRGNLVRADETMLTSIVSIDPIEFYFDIDERALLNYARDARARGGALQDGGNALEVCVRLADERDGSYTGVIDFAENRVDDDSGTIRLRARFDNPDSLFQPGMFGRINVPASLPYQGILVPDEAVGADQNRRIVYILGDDNVVTPHPVRPGPRLYGYRVIREGLTGEETIVVEGLARIRPGSTVTPEEITLPPSADQAS